MNIVETLITTAERTFLARFGKPIEVTAKMKDGAPDVSFQMVKPGLLPTAVERAFFEGVVHGYREALGVLLRKSEPESIN